MKRVLEAIEIELKQVSGLPILFDPQPVKNSEPHLRLTYMGAEPWGKGYMMMKWQLSVTGAGDGPDVYLPEVLAASLRLEALYDKCRHQALHRDISIGKHIARMSFVAEGLAPSGSFSQNEMKVVETGQWSYLFTESRYITVTIPDEFWEKETTCLR